AASSSAVEGVAPERLDRKMLAAERDVRCSALPGADPGALVGVLGAAAVEPSGAGVGVGDSLAVLVSADDREAVDVVVAERIVEAVDEVHAAGRARVGLVGHVGVGEVAARAVVGAPACAEAVLGVAGRRED